MPSSFSEANKNPTHHRLRSRNTKRWRARPYANYVFTKTLVLAWGGGGRGSGQGGGEEQWLLILMGLQRLHL